MRKVDELENKETLEFLETWLDVLGETNTDFLREEIDGALDGTPPYNEPNHIIDSESDSIFEKWLSED